MLLAGILLAGVSLLVLQAGRQAPLTAAQSVVALARAAQSFRDYSLKIEESGTGYLFYFQGQVTDGRLYGRLDKLDLEIYAKDGRYYVRGGEVFQDWQSADQAGLQALDAIIREPLCMLAQIVESDGITVESGPERMTVETICLAYLLEVPINIPILSSLLTVSEQQAVLERFRVYLWFGSEDGFLYRMALFFDLSGPEGRGQIVRIYTLGTETSPLPYDLPPAAGVREV